MRFRLMPLLFTLCCHAPRAAIIIRHADAIIYFDVDAAGYFRCRYDATLDAI